MTPYPGDSGDPPPPRRTAAGAATRDGPTPRRTTSISSRGARSLSRNRQESASDVGSSVSNSTSGGTGARQKPPPPALRTVPGPPPTQPLPSPTTPTTPTTPSSRAAFHAHPMMQRSQPPLQQPQWTNSPYSGGNPPNGNGASQLARSNSVGVGYFYAGQQPVNHANPLASPTQPQFHDPGTFSRDQYPDTAAPAAAAAPSYYGAPTFHGPPPSPPHEYPMMPPPGIAPAAGPADYDAYHDIYASYARREDLDLKPIQRTEPIAGGALGGNQANILAKEKSAFVVDEDFERVVQDIVPTTDHPETPSLTFRVWVIGLFFCITLGVANTIFLFRTNTFAITPYVAVLIAYPMGKLMERYVPSYRLRIFGTTFDTNPGPFTIKEHVLIGIFGTTGASGVYGSSNIVVMDLFYKADLGIFYSNAFLLCTSLLGFGLSGFLRRLVIRPSQMLWPTVLPSVAIFTTFHRYKVKATAADGQWHMSRMKAFFLAMAAAGIFYLVGPGFLSPVLQNIAPLCYFAPRSDIFLQTIGSPKAGVGVLSLSFDWSVIYGSAAMTSPFWATASSFFGVVIWMWVLTPLAYKDNWFAQPTPEIALNSPALMSRDGKRVKVADLVDASTNLLSDKNYEERAPLYMSPMFAFSYLCSMAQFSSVIVHCVVFYGRDIVRRLRRSQYHDDEGDVHCQLIDQYPEVPHWIYLALFAATTALMLVIGQISDLSMPFWATILSIGLAAVATLPIAIVLATTGTMLFMNVISEFVIGFLVPGNPILMVLCFMSPRYRRDPATNPPIDSAHARLQMSFKSLCVAVVQQCVVLLSDLKLGHYMKIPPRHVFIAQIASQVVASGVCWVAMDMWMRDPAHRAWILHASDKTIPAPPGGDDWSGNGFLVFQSAALIWGAVGPRKFFFESVYTVVILGGFALGAVLPIVLWLCGRYIGGPIPWTLIQAPLLFMMPAPGETQAGQLPNLFVAFLFQFVIYRYRQSWWTRYNYVLASAADVGVAIAVLVVNPLTDFGILEAPTWLLNPEEGTFGTNNDGCYGVMSVD
ncbi:OPT super [Blastocladiella emersonii ATCC 22665]|nr:OPT super [Blastocladiella emersonii ATCC 22665]